MENKIYRKIGRRYVPVGVEGLDLASFLGGSYIVSVVGGSTTMRRIPDVHLGFAEGELARLHEHVAQALLRWTADRKSWSIEDISAAAVAAVRGFLGGSRVER